MENGKCKNEKQNLGVALGASLGSPTRRCPLTWMPRTWRPVWLCSRGTRAGAWTSSSRRNTGRTWSRHWTWCPPFLCWRRSGHPPQRRRRGLAQSWRWGQAQSWQSQLPAQLARPRAGPELAQRPGPARAEPAVADACSHPAYAAARSTGLPPRWSAAMARARRVHRSATRQAGSRQVRTHRTHQVAKTSETTSATHREASPPRPPTHRTQVSRLATLRWPDPAAFSQKPGHYLSVTTGGRARSCGASRITRAGRVV